MRKPSHLSVVIAVVLAVGSVAPVTARGAVRNARGASVFSLVDGGQPAKRKGNGFARALGAPFRALARLFGSRKKSSGEAKRKKERKAKDTAPRVQVASAPAAPSATSSAVAVPAVAPKEERKKQRAATVAESAPAPADEPAPAFEPAPKVEPAPAASASVVRPAEGGAELKPPTWVPYVDGAGADHLSQGRALLQQGFASEAVSELSVAAVTGPDLVEANNLLGLAYDRLGMHASAVESYERALSAAPGDPQVLNNLGYSLFLSGNPREALKRLKQAERRAPRAPHVLNNLALVQAGLGKYDDAYKSFARAFGEYDARLKTADLLERAGRADAAVKHYEAALKIQPDSAPLLERLAELYERTGRRAEAEAARQRVGKPQNKQKTTTGGG